MLLVMRVLVGKGERGLEDDGEKRLPVYEIFPVGVENQ